MRARQPDSDGYIERDGVRVFYEVYGEGPDTIVFVCGFQLGHSRQWRVNAPYLSHHFRVITFDPRGNGRSDRPREEALVTNEELARDALAVLDEVGVERAVFVGMSGGVRTCLHIADFAPDRVAGLVLSATSVSTEAVDPAEVRKLFDSPLPRVEGLEHWTRNNFLNHFDMVSEWMLDMLVTEPHSTYARELAWEWYHDCDVESIAAAAGAVLIWPEAAEVLARIRCPVLVHHGDDDHAWVCPIERGYELAEATGGGMVEIGGGGHLTIHRDPVFANLMIRDFARQVFPFRPARRRWVRAQSRPKRALFVATALGLGHIRRDLAIARALQTRHPDLEVSWLCQNPASLVVEAAGQQLHPASARLANESTHFEEHAHDFDLHAFNGLRSMDETLVHNFLLFHDLTEAEHFDLVVGDEAFDVDFHLHENPELKRFAFAWLSDFVGYLPCPDGGEREALLTTDYNAEMVEQRERFKRVRDLSIYVGNPDDLPPLGLGDGLPTIREFTDRWFRYSGYVTGFDAPVDRAAARARLGWGADEAVCVAAVGGTAAGEPLLRKVIAAYPEARRLVPQLRLAVVAGPRIDPKSLPTHDGLDIVGFAPDLYERLAACDLGIVQGGLSTTMELAAAGRPFLYFPLAHHFEQQFFVRHRLERYGAGRAMDFASTTPEQLALAIAAEMGRRTDYRPVETDGAAKAAALLAELL